MSSHLVEVPLSERDLCFVDTETTGSVFGYHEILEIGAVRTSADASHIIGEWRRRIAPRNPERISAFAAELTGYSSDLWREAQSPNKHLWQDFAKFAAGCVPVCHNPSFDRAFITLAATAEKVSNLQLDYHWIGTESLGWLLYRRGEMPRLSLADLCNYLNVQSEPYPHNALDGAHTCRRVYIALMRKFSGIS